MLICITKISPLKRLFHETFVICSIKWRGRECCRSNWSETRDAGLQLMTPAVDWRQGSDREAWQGVCKRKWDVPQRDVWNVEFCRHESVRSRPRALVSPQRVKQIVKQIDHDCTSASATWSRKQRGSGLVYLWPMEKLICSWIVNILQSTLILIISHQEQRRMDPAGTQRFERRVPAALTFTRFPVDRLLSSSSCGHAWIVVSPRWGALRGTGNWIADRRRRKLGPAFTGLPTPLSPRR